MSLFIANHLHVTLFDCVVLFGNVRAGSVSNSYAVLKLSQDNGVIALDTSWVTVTVGKSFS